jgi:hypothetical protein
MRLSRLVERLHGVVTIAWIVSGILGVVALLAWQLVDFGAWPLALIAIPAALIALAGTLDAVSERLTTRRAVESSAAPEQHTHVDGVGPRNSAVIPYGQGDSQEIPTPRR